MKATKINATAKDGRAIGVWLTERAPHVLLAEYNNRKTLTEGAASTQVAIVVEQLRTALGVVATEPNVARLFHVLDGAIWDCAVEHEDRAWHAAWTVAMDMKGGGK